MYSYGSPHMAAQKQDDQHERTFSSYVRIQVVVLKTCLGRWTIGRSGERGSGISVLPARYDDDDDDDDDLTIITTVGVHWHGQFIIELFLFFTKMNMLTGRRKNLNPKLVLFGKSAVLFLSVHPKMLLALHKTLIPINKLPVEKVQRFKSLIEL